MEASQEMRTTFFLSERRDLLKDGIQTMIPMGNKLFFYLKVSCSDFSGALSLSCDSPLTGILYLQWKWDSWNEISYCIEIPLINVMFCSPLNCPIFRGRETEIERTNKLLSFESKPPFYTLLCILLCPLARCYCITGSVGGRLQCWGRQGFSHSCLLLVGFLWASWSCRQHPSNTSLFHQHQQSSTLLRSHLL